MTATFTLNPELNGIELYFGDKPGKAVLDMLKQARWRWHNAKKCWYAKQTEAALELAQTIISQEIINSSETAQEAGLQTGGETGSGYLGGGEWTGINFGMYHSYGDINKAVKKEMQRRFPGVKFKTRGKSYSGGQSSHFYIFLCTDELFKRMDERVRIYERSAHRMGWLTMADGKDVFAQDSTHEQRYEWAVLEAGRVEEQYEIDVHRIADRDEENIFSDYASRIMNTAQSLYASFIHDETNSMVDYFDRNLYDSYSFVNVDNAHKRQDWEV